MAKKAQGSAKSKAKASAQKPSKPKQKAVEKKPIKAAASPKAPASKPTPKAKEVSAAPIPSPKKSEMTDGAVSKPTAKKMAVEKVAQPAETSEKIKIDKSMSDEQVKWVEMYNKYKDTQASVYDMKASFKAASAIQHKILGWGWIVSNDNDRLEVLFRDGKRMLISNYRG